MAIVKLGTTVVGIRGTVGGITFAANRAGNYARAWGRGPAAQTQARQLSNSRFGQLGAWWQALSSAQRDGWDALALLNPEPTYNSLGELIALSGFDYFTRCNGRRLSKGLPVLTDAPSGSAADRPVSPTIDNFEASTVGVSRFNIEWQHNGVSGSGFFVAFGRVFSGGAQGYTPSAQRLVAWTDWFGSPLSDPGSFIRAFGLVPDGWSYLGLAYQESEVGIRSVGVELRTVLGP